MDGQLSPNFIFYHDGEQLGTEGGGATKTYPGKPYVDYVLTTRKSGLLTGEVGRVNSTANVYEVPCKYVGHPISSDNGLISQKLL